MKRMYAEDRRGKVKPRSAETGRYCGPLLPAVMAESKSFDNSIDGCIVCAETGMVLSLKGGRHTSKLGLGQLDYAIDCAEPQFDLSFKAEKGYCLYTNQVNYELPDGAIFNIGLSAGEINAEVGSKFHIEYTNGILIYDVGASVAAGFNLAQVKTELTTPTVELFGIDTQVRVEITALIGTSAQAGMGITTFKNGHGPVFYNEIGLAYPFGLHLRWELPLTMSDHGFWHDSTVAFTASELEGFNQYPLCLRNEVIDADSEYRAFTKLGSYLHGKVREVFSAPAWGVARVHKNLSNRLTAAEPISEASPCNTHNQEDQQATAAPQPISTAYRFEQTGDKGLPWEPRAPQAPTMTSFALQRSDKDGMFYFNVNAKTSSDSMGSHPIKSLISLISIPALYWLGKKWDSKQSHRSPIMACRHELMGILDLLEKNTMGRILTLNIDWRHLLDSRQQTLAREKRALMKKLHRLQRRGGLADSADIELQLIKHIMHHNDSSLLRALLRNPKEAFDSYIADLEEYVHHSIDTNTVASCEFPEVPSATLHYAHQAHLQGNHYLCVKQLLHILPTLKDECQKNNARSLLLFSLNATAKNNFAQQLQYLHHTEQCVKAQPNNLGYLRHYRKSLELSGHGWSTRYNNINEKIIKNPNASTNDFLVHVDNLVDSENPYEAIQVLQDMCERFSKSEIKYQLLIKQRNIANNFNLSEKNYYAVQVCDHANAGFDDYWLLAQWHEQAGDFDAAKDIWGKFIKRYSEFEHINLRAKAYNRLAYCAAQKGRAKLVVKYYKRALQLQPNDQPAIEWLLNKHISQNQICAAKRFLEKHAKHSNITRETKWMMSRQNQKLTTLQKTSFYRYGLQQMSNFILKLVHEQSLRNDIDISIKQILTFLDIPLNHTMPVLGDALLGYPVGGFADRVDLAGDFFKILRLLDALNPLPHEALTWVQKMEKQLSFYNHIRYHGNLAWRIATDFSQSHGMAASSIAFISHMALANIETAIYYLEQEKFSDEMLLSHSYQFGKILITEGAWVGLTATQLAWNHPIVWDKVKNYSLAAFSGPVGVVAGVIGAGLYLMNVNHRAKKQCIALMTNIAIQHVKAGKYQQAAKQALYTWRQHRRLDDIAYNDELLNLYYYSLYRVTKTKIKDALDTNSWPAAIAIIDDFMGDGDILRSELHSQDMKSEALRQGMRPKFLWRAFFSILTVIKATEQADKQKTKFAEPLMALRAELVRRVEQLHLLKTQQAALKRELQAQYYYLVKDCKENIQVTVCNSELTSNTAYSPLQSEQQSRPQIPKLSCNEHIIFAPPMRIKTMAAIGDGNCCFNAAVLGIFKLVLTIEYLPESTIAGINCWLAGYVKQPATFIELKQWLVRNNEKFDLWQHRFSQPLRAFVVDEMAKSQSDQLDYIDALSNVFSADFLPIYEDFIRDCDPKYSPEKLKPRILSAFRRDGLDDTFIVHDFILTKMLEIADEKLELGAAVAGLQHWWQVKGWESYLAIIKKSARTTIDLARWGGSNELTLLALKFDMCIQYFTPGGHEYLGGHHGVVMSEELSVDQLKILSDGNILIPTKDRYVINPRVKSSDLLRQMMLAFNKEHTQIEMGAIELVLSRFAQRTGLLIQLKQTGGHWDILDATQEQAVSAQQSVSVHSKHPAKYI